MKPILAAAAIALLLCERAPMPREPVKRPSKGPGSTDASSSPGAARTEVERRSARSRSWPASSPPCSGRSRTRRATRRRRRRSARSTSSATSCPAQATPAVLVQDVYPYAQPAPVTYMKPLQFVWQGQRTVGGWNHDDDGAEGVHQKGVGLPADPPAPGGDSWWSGALDVEIVAAIALAGAIVLATPASKRRHAERGAAGAPGQLDAVLALALASSGSEVRGFVSGWLHQVRPLRWRLLDQGLMQSAARSIPHTGLKDLAAHPGREEVAAELVAEGDHGRCVSGGVDVERAVGQVAARPREPRRRRDLALVGRIVEEGQVSQDSCSWQAEELCGIG